MDTMNSIAIILSHLFKKSVAWNLSFTNKAFIDFCNAT